MAKLDAGYRMTVPHKRTENVWGRGPPDGHSHPTKRPHKKVKRNIYSNYTEGSGQGLPPIGLDQIGGFDLLPDRLSNQDSNQIDSEHLNESYPLNMPSYHMYQWPITFATISS